MQARPSSIRVLLVDDDEDYYVLIRDMLADISGKSYSLEWAPDEKAALEKIDASSFDVCLLDFRMGEHNGIELFNDLRRKHFNAPVIILTAYAEYALDVSAMLQGAADFLEKGAINPTLLERSIRYAVNHEKTLAALKASEARLRTLSHKIAETQENERRRIARELHDGIGATLTAIKFALEHYGKRTGSEPPEQQGVSLKQIVEMVRNSIEETRRISTDLRPSVMDDLGIVAAVRSMLREFQAVHSKIRIQAKLELREADVPDPLKIVVFRLLQEALNNAFKHSGADAIRVGLAKRKNRLELTVRDNGVGFDAGGMTGDPGEIRGLGLSVMQERVELSDGVFKLETAPGQGTLLRAVWTINGNI